MNKKSVINLIKNLYKKTTIDIKKYYENSSFANRKRKL